MKVEGDKDDGDEYGQKKANLGYHVARHSNGVHECTLRVVQMAVQILFAYPSLKIVISLIAGLSIGFMEYLARAEPKRLCPDGKG